MRVLIIGSGGREHALVWKVKRSALVKKVYCAPGNYGISCDALCIDIPAHDIKRLLAFAVKEKIDLTIVGIIDTVSSEAGVLYQKSESA